VKLSDIGCIKNNLVLTLDGKILTITAARVAQLGTAENIKAALVTLAGKALPDFYVHVNRDGTLALAWGIPPKIWPEDARKE
jgi:hypothetical protein